MPLEFEEAPEVDAGERLITVPCSACRKVSVAAVREHAHDAMCLECSMAKHGAVDLWNLTGHARFAAPGSDTEAYGRIGAGVRPPEPAEERSPPPIVAGKVLPYFGMPEVPGAVTSLAEAARGWGWSTKIMHSRGFGPKKWRGAWQEEELFSVRFGAHSGTPRQAYAVYRTIAGRASWTWRSVWVWGPDLSPFGMFGITELRDYLREGPRRSDAEVLALCARVRTAKLESASEAKARAADAPKKSKAKEGAS